MISPHFKYDWTLATTPARKSLVISVYQAKCAWCGKPIHNRDFHGHHWLVKRSSKLHRDYDRINVIVNVVPLHENCHAIYGQTTEMHDRCMQFVTAYFGSQIISDWLESLRKKNNG